MSIQIADFSLVQAELKHTEESGTITHGYGRAASLTVETKGPGVSMEMDVHFHTHAVSNEHLNQFYNKIKGFVSAEAASALETNMGSGNGATGIAELAGLSFPSNSHDNYYMGRTGHFKSGGDQTKQHLAHELHSLLDTKVVVKGKIGFESIDGPDAWFEREASVYIRICKISFDDGKVVQMLDTSSGSAVVADEHGKTDGYKTKDSPPLNVVSI